MLFGQWSCLFVESWRDIQPPRVPANGPWRGNAGNSRAPSSRSPPLGLAHQFHQRLSAHVKCISEALGRKLALHSPRHSPCEGNSVAVNLEPADATILRLKLLKSRELVAKATSHVCRYPITMDIEGAFQDDEFLQSFIKRALPPPTSSISLSIISSPPNPQTPILLFSTLRSSNIILSFTRAFQYGQRDCEADSHQDAQNINRPD